MSEQKTLCSNVRRGDVRNADYAWKAKQYSWSRISTLFPRGISPTDVDGSIEINGHFLHIELKTEETVLPNGQRLYFERFLGLSKVKGSVFVMQHKVLSDLTVPEDITAMQVWCWEPIKHAILRTNFFDCKEKTAPWWCEQWERKAGGKPNDFTRAMRESTGLYPPSASRPFRNVGGELAHPPFTITGGRVEAIA